MNFSMVRLLSIPVLILVGITAGAYWLDRAAPVLELDGIAVDVDDPAFAYVPRCVGENDDVIANDLRDTFPREGRVTSYQLFNCPRAFDRLTVSFTGEVIGDLITRRGGVWVQVNDDPYALTYGPIVGHSAHVGFNSGIAVWLPDGTHELIEMLGRPATRGDVIRIVGTFYRADPNDGGGLTIRAESTELVAPGFVVDEPLHTLQLVVAGVLTVLSVAALTFAHRARRHR